MTIQIEGESQPKSQEQAGLSLLEIAVIQSCVDGETVEEFVRRTELGPSVVRTLRTELKERFKGDSGGGGLLRAAFFAAQSGLINLDNLPEKPTYTLTLADEKVWQLLAKGYARAGIAKILESKSRAVDSSLNRLYNKLGVDNRYAACAMWVKVKLPKV